MGLNYLFATRQYICNVLPYNCKMSPTIDTKTSFHDISLIFIMYRPWKKFQNDYKQLQSLHQTSKQEYNFIIMGSGYFILFLLIHPYLNVIQAMFICRKHVTRNQNRPTCLLYITAYVGYYISNNLPHCSSINTITIRQTLCENYCTFIAKIMMVYMYAD